MDSSASARPARDAEDLSARIGQRGVPAPIQTAPAGKAVRRVLRKTDLEQAFDDGWVRPGMRVLELGCGAGHHSAWLAQRGCDVLGVDASAATVATAITNHDNDAAAYVAANVAEPGALHGMRFDVLIDPGTLQAAPPTLRPGFAENIRRLTEPGGALLLALAGELVQPDADTHVAVLELLFPAFRHSDRRAVVMDAPATGEQVPAVLYRLVRSRRSVDGGAAAAGWILWPEA